MVKIRRRFVLVLCMSLATYIIIFKIVWQKHNDGDESYARRMAKINLNNKDITPGTGTFTFEEGDAYFSSQRSRNDFDCKYLLSRDDRNIEARINISTINSNGISLYIERENVTTCNDLTRGFIKSSLTKEEESFPIAFSMSMYAAPAQVWTLLQAIYRPQNFYCIHIDKSSEDDVRRPMKKLVECFDNVFISSTSVDVKWGHRSILDAELICLRELRTYSAKWRYYINLTGQEFPLMTNHEIVKLFEAYNGANDIHGDTRSVWNMRWKDLPPPPYNLRPIKGCTYIAASRAFIEYALTSDVARRLLDWCVHATYPDEVFFSTLNFNSHLKVPGAYDTDNETLINSKPYIVRYKAFVGLQETRCRSGVANRGFCILGVDDLQILSQRQELFANKFHWNYGSKVAEYCMAEHMYNKTKMEYLGHTSFNDEYYKKLDFVKNKIVG